MNKYAEEMQKVALNRLAKYMIEHPQHADVLAGMLRRDPGPVAFAGLPRGASNPKLGISLEQRRAAHREMSSVKPMLRHPAQYAEGMHDYLDQRIATELAPPGSNKQVVHSEGTRSSLDATAYGHLEKLDKADADAWRTAASVRNGSYWKKMYARITDSVAKTQTKADSLRSSLEGTIRVNRIPKDSGEGAMYLEHSLSRPGVPSHLPSTKAIHIPGRNLEQGAATGNVDDSLRSMHGALSGHHEVDEYHFMNNGSKDLHFYSHANPAVLARELAYQRGNPYAHLTYRSTPNDAGFPTHMWRDSSGEAEAMRNLLRKPPAPGTPFLRLKPTARDVRFMSSIDPETSRGLTDITRVPLENVPSKEFSTAMKTEQQYGRLPPEVVPGGRSPGSSYARADKRHGMIAEEADAKRQGEADRRSHADLMARVRATLSGGA